ncbi:MAG: PilZ domain-containing protein [Candidatus Rokubacteria bacterium]|nr:PilZ domain-containing protein [Candidatus Rokubacteria bacterium]MBI2554243.1 PilZ domain-containing protein [Candidatus Rokubacteria bacterium]
MGRDRRRYPRVGVALDISVEAASRRWDAKTVDLSPYGVKVALPANGIKLPPGTTIQLRLILPDGDAPLALTARVVRADRDGIALCFEHLEPVYFERLKAAVDSLLEHLSNGPARVEVSIRPVKERRKVSRTDAQLEVAFDAEKPYDWRGKTINLSPYGVKVALPASAIRPSEGTSVKLQLAAPPDPEPLSLKGMVWRREPKSMVLIFVELGREQLERLRDLVEYLQATPA